MLYFIYNNVKVVHKNFIGKTHNITKNYLPLQANSSCEDKTNTILNSKFKWIRSSSNTSSDEVWNSNHTGTKKITITHADIENNATICCKVDIETT